MTDGPRDEEDLRLASGWGRRLRRPVEGPPEADRGAPGPGQPAPDPAEPVGDLVEAADAGAISGRAVTRGSQDLASGDTLGGVDPGTGEGGED